MTALLDQVMHEAMRLPEVEQNVLARQWLLELQSEVKWDHQFAESEDELSELASEALAEVVSNRARILDVERL